MFYDDLGRLDVLSYPNDFNLGHLSVRYHYNEWGFLEDVYKRDLAAQGESVNPELEYRIWHGEQANADLAFETQNYGNGDVNFREYYSRSGRLKSIAGFTDQGIPLQDLSYQYDAIGKLTNQKNRLISSGSLGYSDQSFIYDALNRLTDVEQAISDNATENILSLGTAKTLSWTEQRVAWSKI